MNDPQPAPLNGSRSAGDIAYQTLRRAIETAELPAGAPFVEREQAALLGMSRTPFREALHRLALEGLVERIPKRGTFVTQLDPKDLEDHMIVREAMEIEMVRRLIDRLHTDAEFADEHLVQQRRAIAAGDHRAFLAADEAFHVGLVSEAGNPRAVETVETSWLHVNRVRYLVPMTTAAMRKALSEHRELTDAIRSRSAGRAQRILREHLEEGFYRLMAAQARQNPGAFTSHTRALLMAGERRRAHRSR